MPQNRIPLKSYTTDRKEEDQLDDLKNVGESNYNPGDGTDQRAQSLVFMMMMMMILLGGNCNFKIYRRSHDIMFY
jgi:hypothetical protein